MNMDSPAVRTYPGGITYYELEPPPAYFWLGREAEPQLEFVNGMVVVH